MAGNNQINIGLNFTANVQNAKAQLDTLKQSLNSLIVTSGGPQNIGKGIEAGLQQSIKAAQQLKIHLANATDPLSGNLNLHQFNQSLLKSNTSVMQLSQGLLQGGEAGEQAFRNMSNTLLNAQKPLKATNVMFDKLWGTMKNTMRWYISSQVLMGLTSGISEAYRYAQDLNKALTDIRIVTGKSRDEMDKLAESSNKLAKELKASTLDIVKGQLIFYQQGDSALEAAKKAEISTKVAKVTGDTLQQTSDDLTALWNSYDVAGDELQKYADKVVAVGAATATSSQEMFTAISKVGATAKSVGVTIDQLNATIATISSVTRTSAETVGTALKTIYARIGDLKIGKEDEDGIGLGLVSSQLKTMGVNIIDAQGYLRDTGEVVEEIGNKWQNWTKIEKEAVAQAVAGKRQYTQLLALFDNWDMYKESLGTSMEGIGSLDEQYDIWADSWEGASNRVTANLEEIYTKLFNDDMFIDFTNSIADIIGGIDNVVDKVGGFGGVIANFGALFVAIFHDKIANALSVFGRNILLTFSNTSKATEDILQQMKRLEQIEGFDKLSFSAQAAIKQTVQLSQVTSKYNDVAKNMSATEKIEYQGKMSLIQAYQEEQNLLSSNIQAQEQLAQTIIREGGIGYSSEKINEYNMKLRELMQTSIDSNSVFGRSPIFGSGEVLLGEGSNWNKRIDQYKNALQQLINTTDQGSPKFTKFSEALEKLNKATGDKAKKNAAREAFEILNKEAQDGQIYVDGYSKAFLELTQGLDLTDDQMYELAMAIQNGQIDFETLKNSVKLTDEQIEKLNKQLDETKVKMDLSAGITNSASALMTLTSVYSSFESLVETFNDNTKTSSERFDAVSSSVTSLAFSFGLIAPMVKNAVAAIKAGEAAAGGWVLIISLIVSVGAKLIAWTMDYVNTSEEEVQEALDKAKQSTEELKNLQDEYKSVEEKIQDIKNKTEDITLEDLKELAILKQQRAELEEQVRLTKEKNDADKKEASETRLENLKGRSSKNGELDKYENQNDINNLDKKQYRVGQEEVSSTYKSLISGEIISEEEYKNLPEKIKQNFLFDQTTYKDIIDEDLYKKGRQEAIKNLLSRNQQYDTELRELTGTDTEQTQARWNLMQAQYKNLRAIYGEESEALELQMRKNADVIIDLYKTEEFEAIQAQASVYASQVELGMMSVKDAQDYVNNIKDQQGALNLLREEGKISFEEYSAKSREFAEQITSNLSTASVEIFNTIDEQGNKDLFKPVQESLINLENQFNSGQITSNQYFSSLTNQIKNIDMKKTFGENTKAAYLFFQTMSKQGEEAFLDLAKNYKSNKISLDEYLKNLGSLIDFFDQLNISSESALGKGSQSAEEFSNSLKNLKTQLEDVRKAGSGLAGTFDEFKNKTYSARVEVAKNIQALGIDIEKLTGDAETNTEQLVQWLEKSNKNFSAAQTAVAAKTQQTISSIAIEIGSVLDNLAGKLSSFKFTIKNNNGKISFWDFVKGDVSELSFSTEVSLDGRKISSSEAYDYARQVAGYSKNNENEEVSFSEYNKLYKEGRIDYKYLEKAKQDGLTRRELVDVVAQSTRFGGKNAISATLYNATKNMLNEDGAIADFFKSLEESDPGTTPLTSGDSDSDNKKPKTLNTYDYWLNTQKAYLNKEKENLSELDKDISNIPENYHEEIIKKYQKRINKSKELIDFINGAQDTLSQKAQDIRDDIFINWGQNAENWFNVDGTLNEDYAKFFNSLSKEEQESLEILAEGLSNIKKEWLDFEKEEKDLLESNNQTLNSIYETRKRAKDDYISKSKTTGAWATPEDNELKAERRFLEYWYDPQREIDYKDNLMELNKIREDALLEYTEKEKDTYEQLIDWYLEEWEEMMENRKAYYEAEKNALEQQYSLNSSIREAMHDLNKELQASLVSTQYLDEETRKTLFNTEDYVEQMGKLSKIQGDINDLTLNYKNDIIGKTADEIEDITANYERQYELQEKALEIAKNELEVLKAKKGLENTLNERNTEMFINGQWQWVANTQDVIAAQEALADAQYNLETAEFDRQHTQLTQEFDKIVETLDNEIQKVNDSFDALKDKIDGKPDNVLESIENFKGGLSTAVIEMNKLMEETFGVSGIVSSDTNVNRAMVSTSAEVSHSQAVAKAMQGEDWMQKAIDATSTTERDYYLEMRALKQEGMGVRVETLAEQLSLLNTLKKKQTNDNGGINYGIGFMAKATSLPEIVLPPEITKKILTPQFNENFNNLINGLGAISDNSGNSTIDNRVYINSIELNEEDGAAFNSILSRVLGNH